MNDLINNDDQRRVLPDEEEVYEGRFEATREQIVDISDNYLHNRDFDGISFLSIVEGWDQYRRIYFGTRKDDASQLMTTRTLGYVEITPLKRLRVSGVRVRIVCVWPPLSQYWQELGTTLHFLFPPVISDAPIIPRTEVPWIASTSKKDRVQIPTNYDLAYRRLLDGESFENAFNWWCTQQGVRPSKYDIKKFKEAMRRREKKNKG